MTGCFGRSSRTIFCGLLRYKNLGEATILKNSVKRKQRESPSVDGAKRFYNAGSVDNRVTEFKASRGWKRWMWDLETRVALALFSGVVGVDVYTGSWERVPFTKRRQLLLPRMSLDEDAGEFEKLKKELDTLLLPLLNPGNVARARRIARNLIKGFRRREGDARIKKRWGVVVVNSPGYRIFSYPGGNLVIFGGILNYSGEDAEIAAFIATEMARVVARHDVEKLSMMELLTFLFLLILHVLVSSVPSLSKCFWFPFTRSLLYFVTWKALPGLIQKIYSLKMDLEADYIGLMLLASAGYDPRLALKAREKMARIKGDSSWEKMLLAYGGCDLRVAFKVHEKMVRIKGGSSWEKMRARRLIFYMEEALSIYREVAGHEKNV